MEKDLKDQSNLEDLTIFKEAIHEENCELHVSLMIRLEILAKKFGPKITREELLPCIVENYEELHDDTLLHLAGALKNFLPLVGGLEHSQILFKLLGSLCITDETLVREKAIETMTFILQDLTHPYVEELVLPVIYTLIKDDWFTSRCSAVTLFPVLYRKVGEETQASLRNSLKNLIQDDMPMVRRAAAESCVRFVEVVEEEFLEKEFAPIFRDIAQDPMDSVTSVTVDIAIALMKRTKNEELTESIISTLESLSDDTSWKVRQRLSLRIASIQEELPHPKYRGKLLKIYQTLTQSPELEVRIPAASNLFNYCNNLKKSYDSQPDSENNFEHVFEESIMPILRRLSEDHAESVRLALSSNILPLSSILSDEFFNRNVVALLLQVLSNEESMEIQASFLLGLSSLSEKIDLTQSLDAIKNSLRAIIARSETNWRARRSILTTFLDITKFCSANYFSVHFKVYYATLLDDSVFAIRRSASLILPLISKYYGIKWSSEHLIPFFTTYTNHSGYLYRFVSLFAINEMVHSYLCPQPKSLLGEWKKLVSNTENKTALKAFAKVVKTSHLIQKELNEEKYKSILKLREELDYLSQHDANRYSETDFDTIREKYQHFNLYSVEQQDFAAENWPYLQGVLNLIYNKFLPILETLNKDPIKNIQVRAISTLGEISDFIDRLNKEESEDWVQQAMKRLTEEEITTILDEIHQEFKTATFKNHDLDENLDTTLADSNSELGIIQSLVFDSSKYKSIEVSEIGESLVTEVLEMLDQKISDRENKEELKSEGSS